MNIILKNIIFKYNRKKFFIQDIYSYKIKKITLVLFYNNSNI